jgi:hypothetical protein
MVQVNVGHITAEETHDHYFGYHIKNEQIPMMAFQMRKITASVVKTGKHFSVILDCMYCGGERDSEFDFLLPQAKLSDSFLTATEELGLHISKCRGQGYDKVPNMKGPVKGI